MNNNTIDKTKTSNNDDRNDIQKAAKFLNAALSCLEKGGTR